MQHEQGRKKQSVLSFRFHEIDRRLVVALAAKYKIKMSAVISQAVWDAASRETDKTIKALVKEKESNS